jgi:hypothetical protein
MGGSDLKIPCGYRKSTHRQSPCLRRGFGLCGRVFGSNVEPYYGGYTDGKKDQNDRFPEFICCVSIFLWLFALWAKLFVVHDGSI